MKNSELLRRNSEKLALERELFAMYTEAALQRNYGERYWQSSEPGELYFWLQKGSTIEVGFLILR